MLLLLPLAMLAGCATAPAPANLVADPRFDSGLFEPDAWQFNLAAGNKVTWMEDAHNAGLCAVELQGSGSDWAGATSRAFPVKGGEVFTVVAWIKSEGVAAGGGRFYVRFWGGQKFLGQFGPNAQPDSPMWTLVAGKVTAPAAAEKADFSLQLWSRGTILLGAAGVFRGDVVEQAAEILPKLAPITPVTVKLPHGLPADTNHNGIADNLDKFLGIPAGARSVRLTRRNTTCLQTPTPYRPDDDVKVDTILVYTPQREAIHSWQTMGFHSYFMTGFRDGPAYVKAHPGSVQENSAGHLLDCGPGSYYMVPTADRRRILRDRFRQAFENGAEAACPEEPEFIGQGGYSPAFKREFQDYYHRPWVDPATSPQARFDVQRLMGHLEVELLRACYDGARSVKPDAPCFLFAHSPLNYSAWDISFPFYEAISKLPISDYVAQVWTGTDRTPIRHAGDQRERTFENAYLEYSSALNLVRGRNIPVWLLMDPVEDNPNRAMSDYFRNYTRTLGAALMFPQTDRYEVMPWPTRIFGRVPGPFATTVCTIVTALNDMQNQHQVVMDQGPEGIASFLSDTAMWQRNAPSPSDFDAVYGLTLPLLMRGVPVQIAYLDRVGANDYLKPYKVLLVSFDAMKPERKDIVDGLAAWVKAGGQMLVFGVPNAYDNVDMWWKKEGCASPREYLLKALGLNPRAVLQSGQSVAGASFQVVAKTNYTGHDAENRGLLTLDLTAEAKKTGSVFLKLEDSIKSDGWGPSLASLRLVGTRDGKPVDETLTPGTPQEEALIFRDTGSGLNGNVRFVDGHNELVYALHFDAGKPLKAILDICNQYIVSAAPAPADLTAAAEPVAGSALGKAIGSVELGGASYLAYPDLGGKAALTGPAGALVSEARVGRGGVIVCGLPAAWFAKSPAADQMLRSMVRYAADRAGLKYREQGHIGIRRGPYVMVKTFDESTEVAGPMVNLMSPDLALRPAGPLGKDSILVLKELPKQTGEAPVVAASSNCIEWQATEGSTLKIVVAGPSGTKGVLRLVTGGRKLEVTAQDAKGVAREVEVEADGDTALLRFDSDPMGLGLRIRSVR